MWINRENYNFLLNYLNRLSIQILKLEQSIDAARQPVFFLDEAGKLRAHLSGKTISAQETLVASVNALAAAQKVSFETVPGTQWSIKAKREQ